MDRDPRERVEDPAPEREPPAARKALPMVAGSF
jgi:hypothetical protein